jgi:hypothetical protein
MSLLGIDSKTVGDLTLENTIKKLGFGDPGKVADFIKYNNKHLMTDVPSLVQLVRSFTVHLRCKKGYESWGYEQGIQRDAISTGNQKPVRKTVGIYPII